MTSLQDINPSGAHKVVNGQGYTPVMTAEVVVLAPMPQALSYLAPVDMVLAAGDQVEVPLAHHRVRGVVTAIEARALSPEMRLKPVAARLDEPPVPPKSLAFWLWAANWTMTMPGLFFNGPLSALKAPKAAPRQGYVKSPIPRDPLKPLKMTKARERVLEALESGLPLALSEVCYAAGVSAGVIKGLEGEGALERVDLVAVSEFAVPDPDFKVADLNPSQAASAELMRRKLGTGFAPVLLDGVTGSGKTEVYLETVAEALKTDAGQVLILLPEIALTQAVMMRLKARFGVDPVVWHSGVSPANRRRIWEGVARSEVRLVVGARSALFLPFERLSLIVVDEEHDGSYKQDEGVRYQGRDLAIRRAQMDEAMIVLASATPSLETLSHAQKGRYEWVQMTDRHGEAVLPDIGLIDMRTHAPAKDQWLSDTLIAEMTETLSRGEQVLLFLNRRGYAPLVLCKACGERLMSPNTDSWLVEHRSTGRLVCHLTGFSMKKPARCPHCNAVDSLTSIGPGVERILEEVQARFPSAKAEIFSSDTAPDGATASTLIKRVEDGEVDILIATQAAAKGHNFLNLTLVGIVDADLGLKGGDLRAAERTFQLLAQATGRAGRAVKKGRALIQTYQPDHPAMQALSRQDREGFYAYEMMGREIAKFPPFGRLAAIILSSKDNGALNRFARQLALFIPNSDGIDVFGPADAPLTQVRGQWRKRFLIRADRNRDLQGFMAHWLGAIKRPNIVRMVVDIDPYSFL
jgi:primosomal protein N' (replication factor Y) (superfamily II helicase)